MQEKNVDLSLESLRAQRSSLVDELRTLREKAKENEDGPANLRKIKAEYARLHNIMTAVDKERMTLLENINALTLELNIVQHAHSQSVKNAEDVVVKVTSCICLSNAQINAAEYEWRQKYQQCQSEVSSLERKVHDMLEKKSSLVSSNMKLHEEYDSRRDQVGLLKDMQSKMSANAVVLKAQVDELNKEYEVTTFVLVLLLSRVL